MADPITSQYFPRPPEDAGGTGSSGNQTTYSSDPTVTMGWAGWGDLPSFNATPGAVPPPSGPSGPPTSTPVNEMPLSVNPISMRSSERAMLTGTARAVETYASLKAKVDAAISGGAIYGQTDTDRVWVDTTTLGGQSSGYYTNQASPIRGQAREFAEKMANYQRGALVGLANVLDVVGSYIAAINVAGQTYAATDRAAKFPEPPGATGS